MSQIKHLQTNFSQPIISQFTTSSQQCKSPEKQELSQQFNMDLIKEEQQDLQGYIDNLDNRVAISIEQNTEKLLDTLLVDRNRLERLQRFVKELEEKLKRQDYEVNQNPAIKQDIEQLKQLEFYALKLDEKQKNLFEVIQNSIQRVEQYKNDIQSMRNKLREQNYQSIRIHALKDIANKHLHQRKSQEQEQTLITQICLNSEEQSIQINDKDKKRLFRKAMSQPSIYKSQQFSNQNKFLPPISLKEDPQLKLQLELASVKNRIENTRQQVTYKCNNISEMKRLFCESVELGKKHIQKFFKVDQEKFVNDSTFLDIEQNAFVTQQEQKGKLRPVGGNTALQDRQIRNVLYQSIKNLIVNKIKSDTQIEEDPVNQSISQLNVPYSHFREFTPDQILSLLLLKKDLLPQLLYTFEMKDKSVNLLMLKLKYYVNSKNNRTLSIAL